MTTQNTAVALQFIEAMSTANAQLAEPCLAPDAYTVTKGFGNFAGVRTREVIIGTIAAFTDILPTGLRLQVERLSEADDRVFAECKGNAVTKTGEAYCNEYVFIFTMRDGLITRLDEYFCTALADRVLWPLVAELNDEGLAANPR